MIKVNLLVVKKKKQIKIPIESVFLILLIIVCSGIYFVLDSRFAAELVRLQKEEQNQKKKIGEQSWKFDNLETKEQEKVAIQEKISLIRSLTGDDLLRWSTSFEDLNSAVPPDTVWLTRFSVAADYKVMMNGVVADDTKGLQKFLVDLEKHPNFANVRLQSAAKNKIGKRTVFKFQITCNLLKQGKGGS